MSVAEEIKARLDIVTYIQQYVPLKKSGRYYKACCPFHTERTPSFVVNPDTQSWRCFGACAEGGDVFNFAMKQHGWSFPEALEELGRQVGVEPRKQSPLERQRAERMDALRGLLGTAAEIYHRHLLDEDDASRAVLAYARDKRGLSDETIGVFQIGYAPPGWQNILDELSRLGYDEEQIIEAGLAIKNDAGRVYDRFRNRLMIPIRDERGRVVGFGARALHPDDNPKYMNSPQTPVFDKSRLLFGLDTAKQAIRDSETAVIVEGYLDVIQAHQAGYTNLVAQMGTAMTEAQLKLLVPRYARKIILALDADAAGQNATRRSLETARQTLEADYAGRLSVDIRVLQTPGAKDPDDLIREAPETWAQLVESAVPVADYVIELEAAALPEGATIQERETVARRVLPILAASESDLYKHDNLQKLALRLHIPERDLLSWASEELQAQRKRARPPDRSLPVADNQPPPIDYDAEPLPPPEYLEDEYDAYGDPDHPAVVTPSPERDGRAAEAYGLRLLIQYPEAYYQINRRLRELAGDDAALRQGPLCDLDVDDFTRRDCRALAQMFISAVQQDEMDVLEFLRARLDPVWQSALNTLLAGEDESIRRRMNERFGGELVEVWKQYERRTRPGLDPTGELLYIALDLRLRRINRETSELNFQLMDMQRAGQSSQQGEMTARITALIRARHTLEAAAQEQFSHWM
jgi:DNA primase